MHVVDASVFVGFPEAACVLHDVIGEGSGLFEGFLLKEGLFESDHAVCDRGRHTGRAALMNEGVVFFRKGSELIELKDELGANTDFFLNEGLFEGIDVVFGDGGGASKEIFKDRLVSAEGFSKEGKPCLP